MSMIKRAMNTVEGDLTINNGDVIITNPLDGLILTDNVGDRDRVTALDESGVKTLQIEEIP